MFGRRLAKRYDYAARRHACDLKGALRTIEHALSHASWRDGHAAPAANTAILDTMRGQCRSAIADHTDSDAALGGNEAICRRRGDRYTHAEAAAILAIFEFDRQAVPFGDGSNYRQSEAASLGLRWRRTVETIEHMR